MAEQKIDQSNIANNNKKLIIPKNKQYNIVGVGDLFEFNSMDGKTIYRDVHVNLLKNVVPVLRKLAEVLSIPNVDKMKKTELVQLLTSRIIFEDK